MRSVPQFPLLLEPEELARQLGNPGVLIVDLSWPAAYQKAHIPGAVHLAMPEILYPHGTSDCDIPSDAQLSRAMSALGLTPDMHVVAYDNVGCVSAARLCWTLDAIGHHNYSLVHGAFSGWQAQGLPVEHGVVTPTPSDYHARTTGEVIADKNYILEQLGNPMVVFVDVRLHEEYSNELLITDRGGRIPGAVHLDWTVLVDETNHHRLHAHQTLLATLEEFGITPDKEIIPYCQTHLRSAHTYIVLKWLGFPRQRGYPAGYSEWGNDPDLPIENAARAAEAGPAVRIDPVHSDVLHKGS